MTNKTQQLESVLKEITNAISTEILNSIFKDKALQDEAMMTLAFKVIDNEWYILEEHSDKAVYENRHKLFIDYHNEILEKFENSSPITFYKHIQDLFGQDYIMDVFAKDKRNIIELMAEVGAKFQNAVDQIEVDTCDCDGECKFKSSDDEKVVVTDENSELHNKLHSLLSEVKDVLLELTEDSEASHKSFNIVTKLAQFKIDLFEDEETQFIVNNFGLQVNPFKNEAINEIKRKIEKLAEGYENGLFDKDYYEEKVAKFKNQLKEITK